MKNILIAIVSLLLAACSGSKTNGNFEVLDIDLEQCDSAIYYSHFADSLRYLTLTMGDDDDIFLSNINRLYIEDGFIFLESGREGIFVFSETDGNLVANLNYFGQGPGEFTNIRSFTIDKNKKQIHIFSYPFIHKYTYEGVFIEKIETSDINLSDFYLLKTGEYICIGPEEMGPALPCGVWLTDSFLQFTKTLKEIPPKQLIFVRNTFYNRTDDGLYYYDRVWDDFSFITKDSVEILYNFNLKQKIPAKERTREADERLEPYSFISKFAYADKFILLNYLNFDWSPSYWVLLDKSTNQTKISNNLHNDLSDKIITSTNLFYINNKVWCRVLDFEENNSDIVLEYIYLK